MVENLISSGKERGRAVVWAGACLFLLLLGALASPQTLSGCVMSALISREGRTLDDFATEGPGTLYWHYDDPWDYLAFVMTNSTSGYNNDGYGVVAYSAGDPQLAPSARWYKRVKQSSDFNRVYYSGPYFGWDSSAQGGWDVLDTALAELRGGQMQPAIVLCHARSASGHTFGNHPFTFAGAGRTFSFMHNGWCGGARNFMIAGIRALDPDWFKLHPSEYFGLGDPLVWVDSELLFHYLLAHIAAAGGETLTGLKKGLAGLRQQLAHPQSGVYNFVLSDGDRLYLFRSTAIGSGYKLSYKEFKGFFAVRTLYPGGGDVELKQNELVVLSRDRQPLHHQDFHLFPEEPGYASGVRDGSEMIRLGVFPNPFAAGTDLRITGPAGQEFEATVFDLRGREVWSLTGVMPAAGVREIAWDGRESHGRALAAGVYLIRVRVGESCVFRRVARVE